MIIVSCSSKNDKKYNTTFLGELLGVDSDAITEEQIEAVTSLLIAGNCSSINKVGSVPFGKEGFSWKGSLKGWDEQYGTQLKELDVFQNLLELSILYNSELNDISFVSNMKYLKKLTIHMGKFTDISQLKSCQNLEVLELVGVEDLRDISVIQYLTNLKKLKISGCSIEDFEPISKLKNLEELIITYNHSNIANVESLNGLTNINILYLIYPNIDISFLKDSSVKPKILSVGGGSLDLTDIVEISGIEILNIEEAVIDDLSPLADFNANNISLYNCSIPSDKVDIGKNISISSGISHYAFFWLLK